MTPIRSQTANSSGNCHHDTAKVETENCRDKTGNTRFHVGRAAPINLAVDDFAAEGVDRPRGLAKRHGVDVTGETQPLRIVMAATLCNDAGAPRRKLVVSDRDHAGQEAVLAHEERARRVLDR